MEDINQNTTVTVIELDRLHEEEKKKLLYMYTIFMVIIMQIDTK